MDARRLLLIDDDDDIRDVAAMALEEVGGFEVQAASGGMAGLELARDHAFDVIILDLMMPQLDGVATFERLKSDPATAAIPVIFMTATARSGEHDKLRALGAAGVIGKPFDPFQLPKIITSMLIGLA